MFKMCETSETGDPQAQWKPYLVSPRHYYQLQRPEQMALTLRPPQGTTLQNSSALATAAPASRPLQSASAKAASQIPTMSPSVSSSARASSPSDHPPTPPLALTAHSPLHRQMATLPLQRPN